MTNVTLCLNWSLGSQVTVWNPIKLVTAPFVNIGGTGAWSSMLRRTDLVLQRGSGSKGASGAKADTAVTKFFDEFNEYNGKDSERKANINIIAHSMGAIIANNIIAKYPDMEFSNIVYMAAACRLKDLGHVISPYLERKSRTHFYNLTLNPYRDIW